jgi:tRNA pseudouridine55 synthase
VAGEGADAAVLLFDKPAGVTSHDVVAKVRREKQARKVGHAGTLDPFATGLLLVLLGKATRLQRYLLPLPKTYLATARLGWRSSTGDPDGELRETGVVPERLELPTGHVWQRVPMTSAVRVEGERLYKKAHRGEEVVTPEREIEVYRAELVERGEGTATYEIDCSTGTYVRTLIETLEDAYCVELRRTAVGALSVEQAGREVSPLEALSHLPELELDDEQAEAVSHGRPISCSQMAAMATISEQNWERGPICLSYERQLFAVGRATEGATSGTTLHPEVVLV